MDKKSFFSRNPLPEKDAYAVAKELQKVTVTLIDLALTAKQAHWNVFGRDFLSVHEKLDDVVQAAREGTDVIAERIVQIGHSPDGRPDVVSKTSPLDGYPEGFIDTQHTLKYICDRLLTASKTVRAAIGKVGDMDSLSEDLLQPIGEAIEEQLWMLQSIEKSHTGEMTEKSNGKSSSTKTSKTTTKK